MNKNFRLKEMSDWIKRGLKNKVSITKTVIIRMLMTGSFLSLPVLSYSDWYYFYIDKDTGAASHSNDVGTPARDRGSVLIAKTRGSDIIAEANKHVKNSVIIGVNSYSIGEESTIIGYNSKGIGSQSQVLGSGSVAASQSIAVGSDTFATGPSSIAMGNDDIYNDGQGLGDKLPEKTIERIYEDLWKNEHEFNGKKGKIFNSKQEFDKKYGNTSEKGDNRMYSPTYSKGRGSIAIGSRTVAYGEYSTALGTLNFAFADRSTAIGMRSFVNFGATGGTAIGEESRVFAENSVAVGNKTEATNAGSMAYGYLSKAVGEGSIAIGHTVGSNAKLKESSKTNFESNLKKLQENDNTEKLIKGEDNEISNLIKNTSQNGSSDVIEYEEESETVLTTTKDIHKTKKQNNNAITIGHKSISNGFNSTVIGSSTAVFGSNSIGIGSLVHVTEEAKNSLAFGTGSYISKSNSIGLGTATRVKSKDSMALGVGSSIEENADKSIAFGTGAKVTQNTTSGMALGNGAVANLSNSVALGVNSKTDYSQESLNKPGWVPLGSLSIPTSSKVGVISVGSINQERRITNVASGYALTDAANVGQLKALDDKINRLSVSENDGVRYMSVDRNSVGSKSSELHEIGQKQINLTNYVEAKAHKLLIEARKKLNNETFSPDAIKEIDDVIKKLENKPEVKDNIQKLKELEDELSKTTEPSKFDEIMSKITKAKEETLKKDVLTAEEKKKLEDLNYNNNGAKGKDSIAIGYGAKTETTADQGLAIGYMSKSNEKDTVALGSQSVANTKAGIVGYDPTNPNTANADSTWKSTLGAVSIGDKDKKLTRQIVGVAAGKEDTDAVNVAQLKKLKSHLEDKGLQFGANKGTETTVKLGEKLEIKGTSNLDENNADEKNVMTSINGKTITVKIAKKPKFDEVEAGTDNTKKVVIGDNGVKLGDKTYITSDGINANNQNITNVLTPTDDNHAANKKYVDEQINKVNNGSGTLMYEADDNTQKTIELKKSPLKLKGDGKNTKTEVETDGTVKFSLNNDLTLDKLKIEGTKGHITGLANTTWDKNNSVENRAASEGQLKAVEKGLEDKITKNTNSIEENKKKAEDIKKQADQNKNEITNIKQNIENVVKYENGNKDTVKLEGTNGGTKITNLKNGEVKQDSKDAVNGGQLHEVEQKVTTKIDNAQKQADKNKDDITNIKQNIENVVKYENGNKDTVKLGGTGGTTIKNVKTATQDDEAVNYGQLKNVINKLDSFENVSVENSGDIIQVTKSTLGQGKTKYTVGINESKLNDKVGQTFMKKDGSNLNDTEITNLKNVLGVANLDLNYKAGNDTDSKKTTLKQGLHFKSTSNNLTVSSKDGGLLEFGLNETDKISAGTLTGNGKIVTEKALIDYIKDNLGSISDDLADTRNNSGSAKEDNLNGKHVNDKVNAIRRGEAGTVVYTNENGDRVVKAKNGKWYKASDVTNGNSNNGATEISNDKVRLSIVNEDGTTTKESILSNIEKGKISENSKDAINGSQLHDFGSEMAKALGGSAKFENGKLTSPTYAIKGNGTTAQNYTNVGEALTALDNAISNVNSNIGNSNLSYKANGTGNKSTTLTNGLNFTNTDNITASVEDNGVVKHNLNKDLKNVESIKNTDTGTKLTLKENELSINDKKISGVQKGELGENSTDAVNGSQLFETNKKVEKLEDKVKGLGEGVISDKDPNKDKTVTGKTVYEYVEGKLKDTNSKIKEIESGQAGTVVYTNENGERLVKGTDNKYYLKNQLNTDGTPKTGEKPVEKIKSSLVNSDGTTTNASVLSNVAKGKVSEDSTDAVNGSQLHSVEKKVDDAVSKLGKGLSFGADNKTETQNLGSTLTINKGDTSSDYKGKNLETKYEKDANGNGKITIGFKDRPEFSEIKVGDANNKVTIGAGTITGLKDLDNNSDSSSAVNKKYVDNKLSSYYEKKEIDNKFNNYYDKNAVDKKLDSLGQSGQKALAGVANAIAIANLPQVQPSCGRNYALAGAYGNYGKESAFAVGLSGTTKKGDLVYKLSGSVNTKGNVGLGAGFAYVFGLRQNKGACTLEYTTFNGKENNSALEKLKSENESIKETVQNLQNENKEMKELIKQILDRQISSVKLFTLGGYISNKDVITKVQRKDLINIINEINKNYAGRTIDITGYADINGGDKFNLELGYRRAKKVVELLHSLGLSNTVKIGKVSSSGMNNMVSDTNKSANRRVEIIVR